MLNERDVDTDSVDCEVCLQTDIRHYCDTCGIGACTACTQEHECDDTTDSDDWIAYKTGD